MELISQSIHLAEVEDTQAALVAVLSEVCRDELIVKALFVILCFLLSLACKSAGMN